MKQVPLDLHDLNIR